VTTRGQEQLRGGSKLPSSRTSIAVPSRSDEAFLWVAAGVCAGGEGATGRRGVEADLDRARGEGATGRREVEADLDRKC
jgi:hypothetical protein